MLQGCNHVSHTNALESNSGLHCLLVCIAFGCFGLACFLYVHPCYDVGYSRHFLAARCRCLPVTRWCLLSVERSRAIQIGHAAYSKRFRSLMAASCSAVCRVWLSLVTRLCSRFVLLCWLFVFIDPDSSQAIMIRSIYIYIHIYIYKYLYI